MSPLALTNFQQAPSTVTVGRLHDDQIILFLNKCV